MNTNYWKRGSWNVLCDICGFKFKSPELKTRWDGMKVCGSCFETRHPMDFLKSPKETLNVPWTRPQQTDTFVTLNSYTPYINWVNVFDEGIPNWEVEDEV